MKINLSSRCRYRDFRLDNAKLGEYLIESDYAEPYIVQVIYSFGKIRVQIIARVDINGNVFLSKVSLTPLERCKMLPKKHVHNLNKLILLS